MEELKKKTIFVIMPFRETPTRDADALTAFFIYNLKKPIERNPIAGCQFVVCRSEDAFDINAQIIRDLYTADIVICDLSGYASNPNVMYELGMRLAFSNKPVILIREEHPNNKLIFDISGFHFRTYNPLKYFDLEEYILKKIERYETKKEVYRSPVWNVLEKEPSIIESLEERKSINKLAYAYIGISGMRRSFATVVSDFAHQNHININFDKDIGQFQLSFLSISSKLEKLDWSRFEYNPHCSPYLDALILEPPPDGLVPNAINQSFILYLQEFYNTFFLIDGMLKRSGYSYVLLFITESAILSDLVTTINNYLQLDDKHEKEKESKDFVRIISLTTLIPKQLLEKILDE